MPDLVNRPGKDAKLPPRRTKLSAACIEDRRNIFAAPLHERIICSCRVFWSVAISVSHKVLRLPVAGTRYDTMSGDEEEVEFGGGGDNIVWFLYTGQDNSEIPRDVTHARIDPSVKVIAAGAFRGCEQLVAVELCEGLELIGQSAFYSCKSLKCFKAPPKSK